MTKTSEVTFGCLWASLGLRNWTDVMFHCFQTFLLLHSWRLSSEQCPCQGHLLFQIHLPVFWGSKSNDCRVFLQLMSLPWRPNQLWSRRPFYGDSRWISTWGREGEAAAVATNRNQVIGCLKSRRSRRVKTLRKTLQSSVSFPPVLCLWLLTSLNFSVGQHSACHSNLILPLFSWNVQRSQRGGRVLPLAGSPGLVVVLGKGSLSPERCSWLQPAVTVTAPPSRWLCAKFGKPVGVALLRVPAPLFLCSHFIDSICNDSSKVCGGWLISPFERVWLDYDLEGSAVIRSERKPVRMMWASMGRF